MRKWGWTGVLAAAVSALTCAAAQAECKLNQIIELPVTMVGARPTVTLYVNGQPARFLVDSGAWASSIDTTAARALGLSLAKTDEKARGVGGDVDLYFTTIDSLGLTKDLSLGRVDMLASAGVGGGGIVGLLGENVLGFADVEYDFPHGAMRFFRQEGCQKANLGYWADGGAVEVPLTHTGRRPPSRDRDPSHYDPGELDRDVRAVALVNGQKVTVTFDTGASTSILNTSVAARAGVTPDTPGAVSTGLFGGVGSELKSQWIAPFDSFALGAERINHTRMRFGDLNRVQTDMLLGADFFLSHRIFISNGLNKAFISYVGGPVFRLDDVKTTQAQSLPLPEAASDPAALVREAAARSGRRDHAGAIALLDRAIAADGRQGEAHLLRGRAKLALGEVKAAMDDFGAALQLEPDNFEALVSRGARLARDGDLVKARQDLEHAARLKTPDGRARIRVALAYEAARDYADAIAQFDAILSEKTSDEMRAAAYNGRCWNRALMRRDLDAALADCNRALGLDPKNFDILDSRALVHMRRGELDLALADYDSAIRIQPGSAATLYARAAARMKKGLKTAGAADLAAARKLDPKIGEWAKGQGVVDPDFDPQQTDPVS